VSFSNYISRHHIDCHCCWLDGRSSSGNCRWDNVLKLNPLLAVVAYDMQKITVKLRHNYGANRLVLTCYFTAIHQMMATKPVCRVAFLSRIIVFWYYDIFDTSNLWHVTLTCGRAGECWRKYKAAWRDVVCCWSVEPQWGGAIHCCDERASVWWAIVVSFHRTGSAYSKVFRSCYYFLQFCSDFP